MDVDVVDGLHVHFQPDGELAVRSWDVANTRRLRTYVENHWYSNDIDLCSWICGWTAFSGSPVSNFLSDYWCFTFLLRLQDPRCMVVQL